MAEPKTLIAGMSIAGAAAAGVVILAGLPFIESDPPALEDETAGFSLCLRSDMPFFEGADAKCYSHTELFALSDRPVLNAEGAPVSVAMTHPTDMSAEKAISRTCGVWLDLKREGWFALTSSDQRREAFFIRACGALSLMLEARPAEINHFADGSLTPGEVVALLRNGPFGIGAGETDDISGAISLEIDENDGAGDADAGDNRIAPERTSPAAPLLVFESTDGAAGGWRLEYGGRLIVMQELALADFDGDDTAELLVFTRAGATDGTAVSYALGLLEKDSPDAALSFTASDFAS